MEAGRRPRIWRRYWIANAPRPDGTFDLHIRLTPGGLLSPVLVRQVRAGDSLRIGAPMDSFALDATPSCDLLLIAGSVGLAPLKALVEEVAHGVAPRNVTLFFDARHPEGLYDLADLETRAAQHSWLRVVAAVSQQSDHPDEQCLGLLPTVVARHGPWHDHTAYVCGSRAMVRATIRELPGLGLAKESIHMDWYVGE